jgi:hypothetical protein
MRISRGFVGALVGLAISVLAWCGSWMWPAWPAFAALHLAFPKGGFGDLTFPARAAVIVALLALNVACWGLIAVAAIHVFSMMVRARTKRANG